MQLAIRDLEILVGVPGDTLYRWAKTRRLPLMRVGDRHFAGRFDLLTWALSTGTILARNPWVRNTDDRSGADRLVDAVELGGTRNLDVLEPGDLAAALPALLETLPEAPAKLRDLMRARLSAAMSGAYLVLPAGLAVPHPRHPLLVDVDRPIVRTIFFGSPLQGLPASGAGDRSARITAWCWILAPRVDDHALLLAEILRAAGHARVHSALLEDRSGPTLVTALREFSAEDRARLAAETRR